MRLVRSLLVIACVGSLPLAADTTALNCSGPGNVEEFRYTWRLRGGLGWIAGLVFPRSGVGNLKTTYPTDGDHTINSELLITAPQGASGGFYAYQSEMDSSGGKTLVTYHGYAWGKKSRKERTNFDYAKRQARIHKETPDKTEDRVKLLPAAELRDILTAIYFLRSHADTIKGPITTSIYSDGKEYPVIFRPIAGAMFTVENRRVGALGFEIVDAPGGKKWPGGVRLWLSNDARRIPLRIDIQQSLASMQLDLKSIEGCAFMQARK
jgi:hypothetical protein